MVKNSIAMTVATSMNGVVAGEVVVIVRFFQTVVYRALVYEFQEHKKESYNERNNSKDHS